MSGPIATLRVMLAGDDAHLRTSLSKSEKASKKWAKVQQRQAALARQAYRNVAVGVAAAAASTLAATKVAIEYADGLAKQSRTLGITVEQLQEYTFAAERSGVSTEEMVKGLQQFNKFVGQAARGTGTAKVAFEHLGISLNDSTGKLRTSADLIDEFVNKMAAIESPAMRAGLAADVFGRAGVKLLPMMDQGAEGMDRLKKAAHDLGNVLDGEVAAKAEVLNDRLGEITTAIKTKTTTVLVDSAWSISDAWLKLGNALEFRFGVQLPMAFTKFRIGIKNSITKGFNNGAIAAVQGMQKLINSVADMADYAPDWLREFLGWGDAPSNTTFGNSFIERFKRENAAVDAEIAKLTQKLIMYGEKAASFTGGVGMALEGPIAGGAGGAGGGDGGGGAAYDAANDPLLQGIEDYNKLMEKQAGWEQTVKQSRMDNMQSGINLMGQFAKKGSALAKITIMIQTALNIAQIAMSTEVAKMRALAELGPIAGAPMAASIQAMGAVTMGIAGAAGAAALGGQFHDGINYVPGTGTYLLEKGERVVDSRLNADLTKALDGGGMGGGTQNITFAVQGVEDPDVINRVINENRGEFESMLRQINTDRAGAGLV